MPQQLSGLDATFLEAETETAFMHALGVLRFGDGEHLTLSVEELHDHLDRRMSRMEPLRRRLVEVPGHLDQPYWVDVSPDPAEHLTHVRLPEGSDEAAFENLCAEVAQSPLDRGRPLWHFWLVDGLPAGGQGLIAKLHHSVSDGVGSMAIVSALLDMEPAPDEPEPERRVDEPEPDPGWLLTRATGRMLRWPIDAVRTSVELGSSAARVLRLRRIPHPDMAVPLSAPKLAMSGTVSAQRSVTLRGLPLQQVKDVAHRSGAHVNDVVLATLAGGLRRWLDEHDELPDEALVAAVPVSLRSAEELGDAGNKVSACFVHLATHIANPLERLKVATDAATGGKEAHLALGPHTIEHFTSMVFPNIVTLAMQTYSKLGLARMHPPPVNLVASNVAGPQWPLYLAGRRVTSMGALGPIFDGVPLNVTVISYDGKLVVGLLACPERVPDLDGLADAMIPAFEELREAARTV